MKFACMQEPKKGSKKLKWVCNCAKAEEREEEELALTQLISSSGTLSLSQLTVGGRALVKSE